MRRFVIAAVIMLCGGCASAAMAPDADVLARGRQVYVAQGCYGCHTLEGAGTPIAPDLSQIGHKDTRGQLEAWLRDPAMQQPTAHMPKIQLREDEVQALAAFLASLG